MKKRTTRIEALLPKPRATRIDDLAPLGDELSEEQLRLVVGSSGPIACTAVQGRNCDYVPK
jgi:hypothetical protein